MQKYNLGDITEIKKIVSARIEHLENTIQNLEEIDEFDYHDTDVFESLHYYLGFYEGTLQNIENNGVDTILQFQAFKLVYRTIKGMTTHWSKMFLKRLDEIKEIYSPEDLRRL